MSDNILLFFVIQKLYQILPLENLHSMEKLISSKEWGMGDICFTCKDEYEKHLNFLILPKKVKFLPVQIFNKPTRTIPHCKDCSQKVKHRRKLNCLASYLYVSQRGGGFYISNPISKINPNTPWDPVSYYQKMQDEEEVFFDLETVFDFNSLYPSIYPNIADDNLIKLLSYLEE